MSIELKQAAQQALDALLALHADGARAGWHLHPKWEAQMRAASDSINALRTAIQQAESEPVLFVSPKQARAVTGKNRVHYTPSDNSGRYLPVRATPAGLFTQPLYTHPAPGVPGVWVDAAERVPLESDGEVFVRFTDGSIGTAWATYWHGASNAFAQWTHPDPDEDRTIAHWMKAPALAASPAQKGGE